METRKDKKSSIRKYRIIFPAGAIVLGILLVVLFFVADLSGIMFLAGLLMAIFGAIFLKRWWGNIGEDEQRVIITDKKEIPKNAVSLNIYPNRIVFEETPEPKGQPWKCENDGKYYCVHIWDEKTNGLIEFQLPDQAYMDPQLLATRVLELPAHRRIFRRKQTLLQQLSPMMAALGVVIMWIIIITTT